MPIRRWSAAFCASRKRFEAVVFLTASVWSFQPHWSLSMTTKSHSLALSNRLILLQKLSGNPGGLGDYNTSSTSVAATSYTNSRDGTSQPKWRSIIKNGASATTVLTGTRVRRLSLVPFSGTVGFNPITGDPKAYVETITGSSSSANAQPGHLGSASLSKAENRALISALRRVREQRTQVQGMTFLGELKETIQMLKRPFAGARKYIDRYFSDLSKMRKGRNGQWKGRAARTEGFLSEAGSAWLEVSFGIQPLLSDVKGIAEALARSQIDSRRTVISGTGTDIAVADSTSTENYGNYSTLSLRKRITTTYMVRYKVYLDYSRSSDIGSSGRLMDLAGFRLDQFVPTVWELVPWSFLVDYFTNIGDVLEAGCTSQNEIKFVVRTQRLETVDVTSYTPGLSNPAHLARFWQQPSPTVGESIISRATISRSPSGYLDTPTFELSLPGTFQKVGNMLALWANSGDSLTKGLRSRGR